MNAVEQARQAATMKRLTARIRWEERCRAFDIVDFQIGPETPEPVAEALWTVAGEIMRSKD